MTFDLEESRKYANPYTTNRNYLRNMTRLQMKALEGMEWDGEYIRDSLDLWVVPAARSSMPDAKITVNYLINDLNEELMRL